MAISGKQNIDIGLPNESANSDSLYEAFTKIDENFDTLFANSSQYDTFQSGNGISVSSNSVSGTVTITNTGVTGITAGTNIVVDRNDGVVTISSTGGGGAGGTVTSVGIVGAAANARIGVSGPNPIVSSGTFTIDLQNSGVSAGTYTYPTLTVDQYGRVTNIANANSIGTVTSVGIAPGAGIQVSNSPITTSGVITIVNTGVTRLSAGYGIQLSGSNGNVTISSINQGGTVTSVALTSNTLVVTGSPIYDSGTITVNLPNNISISGSFSSNTLTVTGNTSISNLSATGLITAAGRIQTSSTLSVAGNSNIANLNVTGSITATGNIRSSNLSVTSNAIVGNLTGANITTTNTVSTLNLIVNGNSNVSNMSATGFISASGNIRGGNLTTAGALSVTGNSNVGNLGTSGTITAFGATMNSLTTTGNASLANVNSNGIVSATGNVRAGNLISLGLLSVAGNVTVGNVTATTGTFTNLGGTLTTAAQPNITSLGILTSVTTTGTIQLNNSQYLRGKDTAGNTTRMLGINASDVVYIGSVDTELNGLVLTAGGNGSLSLAPNGAATASSFIANSGVFIGNGNGLSSLQASNIVGSTLNSSVVNSSLTALGTITNLSVSTNANVGALISSGNISGGNLISNGILTVNGTAQSSISGNLTMNNKNIVNLADPVNPQDAVTKNYADNVAQGLDVKASVKLATAAVLPSYTYNNGASGVGATLIGSAFGALSIDGIAVSLNDRVLIKNEGVGNSSPYNGIYSVTETGNVTASYILTRTNDFNSWSEVPGGFVFVETGTVNADSGWVCTSDETGTIGITSITFVQFSGAGTYSAGTGLTLTGTTFSVNNNQSQITGVGTLTSLSVSGNSNIANLGITGTVTASGNISSSNNLITTGSGGNIIMSGGNITGVNNISANTLSATGVINASSLTTIGNVSVGNLTSAGTINTSGNISGNHILGNGSQLTGITIIPTGVITMWYGSIVSIPSGWYLCDGSNGTPDLRNRFVIGAGSTYAPGATGGSKDAVVVSHSHSISDPGHNHSVPSGGFNPNSFNDRPQPESYLDAPQTTGTSVTGISINTTGESGTDKNLPPYYALCYIMKA